MIEKMCVMCEEGSSVRDGMEERTVNNLEYPSVSSRSKLYLSCR
jgi:hypothetical protein